MNIGYLAKHPMFIGFLKNISPNYLELSVAGGKDE
eukprot:COSAG02_NODE_18313_length_946_cov_1.256198_1_plen_34_part_01